MSVEVDAFAQEVLMACSLTEEFLTTHRPRVDAATAVPTASEEESIRLSTLRGYHSRALAWLRTIAKLNNPGDVQAAVVGARALFEGTVDLVLIRNAPTQHSFQKMFDWERSAILKHAEKVRRFFEGRALPAEYAGIPVFLQSAEVAVIRASRVKWWRGDHPLRWTGADLSRDAATADSFEPAENLREFYELEFSAASWTTHGSTLAGLRSNDPNFVTARWCTALHHSHRFALNIARKVMEDLGHDVADEFAEFAAAARRRTRAGAE